MPKFDPDHATAPDTNFADKNSAEKFLECGKFRRCANLLLAEAHLPGHTLYVPVCTKSRFNRQGVAQHIEMPDPKRALGPITYRTVAAWAPLISCPRDCREYQNPTLAKIKAAVGNSLVWTSEHVIKPSEIVWAAFWAWVMK
jgi:hypothetical protein